MVFICKNCNFRLNKHENECPFCGMNESIEKEKNASEIIEEIDRLLHS